jgi:Cu/Ag efflux pump CusA
MVYPMNNDVIRIQSVGFVPAVAAERLTLGMRTVWNFGYIETVCGIRRISKASISVLFRSEKGDYYARTFRKSRLVAVTGTK